MTISWTSGSGIATGGGVVTGVDTGEGMALSAASLAARAAFLAATADIARWSEEPSLLKFICQVKRKRCLLVDPMGIFSKDDNVEMHTFRTFVDGQQFPRTRSMGFDAGISDRAGERIAEAKGQRAASIPPPWDMDFETICQSSYSNDSTALQYKSSGEETGETTRLCQARSKESNTELAPTSAWT